MFLGDFHTHSNFSDGKLTIPKLVDLYGQRGFGVLAITDHVCEEKTLIGRAARTLAQCLHPDTYPDYLRIMKREANRAWKEYRMIVLPGLEFSKNSISNSRSAHVLAVGVEEYLSADGSIEELCTWTRDKGGLTIAAHPVHMRTWEKQTLFLWNQREKLRSYFDAWEVASGPKLFPEVMQSGLPMIANSDLHHPKQIRSWKTAFHCPRDKDAIFESIRRQTMHFSFYDQMVNRPFPVIENLWPSRSPHLFAKT